jgi:hypothetical protein
MLALRVSVERSQQKCIGAQSGTQLVSKFGLAWGWSKGVVMPVDVFISYRGADRVLARKLEQRLRSRWGSRVFRDETSLMPGHSWAEQLRHAMTSAKVMLALVGPGWKLRDGEEDWVRDELLGAIEANNPVLPVLVGDPDELTKQLETFPEGFGLQAVKVSPELAGFDLHKVEKALRDLGAFEGRGPDESGQHLSEVFPTDGQTIALESLREGRSVFVVGASGSGRSALLRRIARSLETDALTSGERGLVAACGIDLGARNRRTHRVVAAWIDDLCRAIQDLPADERAVSGPALVNAVITFGPDLLGRQVLRAGLLLPLGDDDSDQAILQAARRRTDQWAPFPPERLVSQSVNVIEQFVAATNVSLTLIADNIESLDGSSKDLVKRLLRSSSGLLRLVLATSTVHESVDQDVAKLSTVLALDFPTKTSGGPKVSDRFEGAASISLHDPKIWGEPGAVIEDWLRRHHVELSERTLVEKFEDPNPYYALSALWYMVDNGMLVELPPKEIAVEGERHVMGSLGSDSGLVTWLPAGAVEDLVFPSRDRLLDHKVGEFVPVGFREIIEAGALIGRRFSFSAAYAAVEFPESVDGPDPSTHAIEKWQAKADSVWERLAHVDPDGSVIICHLSTDGERVINLAQADLVPHLAEGLSVEARREFHTRLARYFAKPFANDVGTSLDDRYIRAKAAAHHWAHAGDPRSAADAERFAAGLAEQALAYQEAQEHYQRAIRLFTQLLADQGRNRSVSIDDHQDRLILAFCLYRLGQMTRLADGRGSSGDDDRKPTTTTYFDRALKQLQELSENLHDMRVAAPISDDRSGTRGGRDVPEPNVIRHHIRLCEVLSGWVNLELAQWHELREDTGRTRGLPNESRRSRELLFETLRHAEAARGEADSRWLLAAASARLAQQLVDDAIEADHQDRTRAHNLTIEALFQIERVIGLRAVSPDEDRDLEDPRSHAWMVLGRILQTRQIEPRLAEWAFRRMNDHRPDVSDLVDMMTDRQLGLFLLSKPQDGANRRDGGSNESEARTFLDRHKTWAIECGIEREHSAAYLSLALLELVEQDLEKAWKHVMSVEQPIGKRQKENTLLLQGVLYAVEKGGPKQPAFDHEEVAAAFRRALDLPSSMADDEVLRTGWKTTLLRLLRLCPPLKEQLGLDRLAQSSGSPDRPRFIDDLVRDDELQQALCAADRYLEDLKAGGGLVPSNDRAIWKMLEVRVADVCLQHARKTQVKALSLFNIHRHHELSEVDVLDEVLVQDLSYAVVVHEWYRSTDPSRLLTLARESNMSIDGAEWASPKLLSGRLAIRVLDHQYGARDELGRERFERIKSLVDNWADGSETAGPLEQLFYVAVQLSEPVRAGTSKTAREPEWHRIASTPELLGAAYRSAKTERAAQARQAGLPLVQDLLLLDAEALSNSDNTGSRAASQRSGGVRSATAWTASIVTLAGKLKSPSQAINKLLHRPFEAQERAGNRELTPEA